MNHEIAHVRMVAFKPQIKEERFWDINFTFSETADFLLTFSILCSVPWAQIYASNAFCFEQEKTLYPVWSVHSFHQNWTAPTKRGQKALIELSNSILCCLYRIPFEWTETNARETFLSLFLNYCYQVHMHMKILICTH